ncbi:MAG TPA: hypothetical protein VGR08_11955 [Thermomicrobiales bacterium]|nr:hypothetical protein [Thermomicrobiales bacterium]
MRGTQVAIVNVALVVSVGVAVLVSGGGTDHRLEVGTAAWPSDPSKAEDQFDADSALATPNWPHGADILKDNVNAVTVVDTQLLLSLSRIRTPSEQRTLRTWSAATSRIMTPQMPLNV